MASQQQPLIIQDFQKGVADSPLLGHALMRNIDIESHPGAMLSQKKLLPCIPGVTQRTFTADAGTDICTASGNLNTADNSAMGSTYSYVACTFTTTGTLPAGLSTAGIYHLIRVNDGTETKFKVATSYANAVAGTYIDITGAGTGTHTINPIAVGTIKNIVRNKNDGYYYAQDSAGRVYHATGNGIFYLMSNNTLTNANGNGLVVFRVSDASHTYLLAFRNNKIDVADITDDTAIGSGTNWTNDWQTLQTAATTNNRHFAIVGQDNIIYYTDDRYVGSIQEKPGSVFVPGTAATFTFNGTALTVPQAEKCWCLEELGVNLLVGGKTFNKIYPWDRTSDSFSLPILLPESGVYEMRNLGGTVYVFAGTRGNIYTTQGSYARNFKRLPNYITNIDDVAQYNPITWGGTAVRNNAILFGLGTIDGDNDGVHMVYPDGTILQDNTPYAGARIAYAIYAENDFYLVGSSSGVDQHDSNRQSGLNSVFHSMLYQVGLITKKASYTQLELLLAKPGSGSIKVSWRPDLNSTFTEITTFLLTPGVTSYSFDCGLIDIVNIQIALEFNLSVVPITVRLIP